MKKQLLWINGELQEGNSFSKLNSPYGNKAISEVAQASAEQLETAITAAHLAFHQFRKSSRFLRNRLLLAMAKGIEGRRQDFVNALVDEAGKPYQLADVEVTRAISTFTLAAEEVKKFVGELVPIDLDSGGRAFSTASAILVPRGPVLAITPFNFPLNLVAHKVAPALAVGTSVLLKPPPQAPRASGILAEVFASAAKEVSDEKEKVPLAALQVVNGSNEVMEKAVRDPRLSILSFTGSDRVGWILQEKAIKKRVLLELGGNAAVIVHQDADLKRAAARCAFGAFSYAGQICISVQRIYAHSSVYDQFLKLLLEEIAKLKVGDPADKQTVVGPMIDSGNCDRILSWIDEAKKAGANVLVGGTRNGNIIAPTLLGNVAVTSKLQCEEAFGPIAVIEKYSEFSEAVGKVNQSKFGLQAGIFSESAKILDFAKENLDVGGVLLNEIPTFRADNMPYGGMKESGIGREGVKYAMQEFCDWKTLVSWHG